MFLALLLKNILILLRNYTTFLNFITKKLKKKNITYIIIYLLINIFILPDITFCDTNNIEEISDDKENDLENKKKFSKKIFITICFLSVITIVTLAFIYFLPDSDINYDSSSDSSDLGEVIPKKPVEYIPARGYDFFVQDMGIIYDSDIETGANPEDF